MFKGDLKSELVNKQPVYGLKQKKSITDAVG